MIKLEIIVGDGFGLVTKNVNSTDQFWTLMNQTEAFLTSNYYAHDPHRYYPDQCYVRLNGLDVPIKYKEPFTIGTLIEAIKNGKLSMTIISYEIMINVKWEFSPLNAQNTAELLDEYGLDNENDMDDENAYKNYHRTKNELSLAEEKSNQLFHQITEINKLKDLREDLIKNFMKHNTDTLRKIDGYLKSITPPF